MITKKIPLHTRFWEIWPCFSRRHIWNAFLAGFLPCPMNLRSCFSTSNKIFFSIFSRNVTLWDMAVCNFWPLLSLFQKFCPYIKGRDMISNYSIDWCSRLSRKLISQRYLVSYHILLSAVSSFKTWFRGILKCQHKYSSKINEHYISLFSVRKGVKYTPNMMLRNMTFVFCFHRRYGSLTRFSSLSRDPPFCYNTPL